MSSPQLTPAVADILAERQRQDRKWGQQDHDPFCWITVLGEEFGEASQAALAARFSNGDLAHYREELVQVAAVALAMIDCLDRNNWNWGDALQTISVPRTQDAQDG